MNQNKYQQINLTGSCTVCLVIYIAHKIADMIRLLPADWGMQWVLYANCEHY